MTRALVAAAIIGVGSCAFGQATWQPNPQSKFCGLNTLSDPAQIDDCDTPDAQNVLTDGSGVEKRPGNTRIATILAGYAVAFVGEFVAPSGTRYLIAHSSTSVYESDLGAATPVLMSTTAASANIDMISAYGKAIFQDGTGNPWYWDGTTTATLAGMPVGSYMGFADERAYVANIAGESSSRVRVSSFGGVSYFTVPTIQTADSPTYFDFQKDDGEGIVCFKVTPWGKFVGKRHSTHMLKGYDNTTYYKRIIDTRVGCIDNRSVQMVDGLLIWMSYDGIYAWQGTGPPLLLTKDINPTIRAIRQINSVAAQWAVDVLGDWNQGVSSNNGPTAAWSTTLTPGSIVPSSTTFYDASTTTFLQGTLTRTTTYADVTVPYIREDISSNTIIGGTFIPASSQAWVASQGIVNKIVQSSVTNRTTFTCNGNPITVVCPADASGNEASYCAGVMFDAGFSNCNNVSQALKLTLYDGPTGASAQNYDIFTGNFGGDGSSASRVDWPGSIYSLFTATSEFVCLSDQSGGCASAKSSSDWYIENVAATPLGFNVVLDSRNSCDKSGTHACVTKMISNVRVSSCAPTATFVSRTFDTSFATPTFNAPSVSISSDASKALTLKEQASSDGSSWDAAASWTPGNKPASKKRYWRYELDFATSVGTRTANITQFASAASPMVAIGTGTYYSDVHFIGANITSFLPFNATVNDAAGLVFQTRTSATTFGKQDAAPSWTNQSNNTTIGSTPAAYYQFRIDSTNVAIATEAAQALRVASNWQEGSGKPIASGVKDHRYFICAQFSSTTVQNDQCLILQKNNRWIPWNGPGLYSMGTFNNDLIAGSTSTSSAVWKLMQDGVYQDDGVAINAYWTSKHYSLDKPFQQKILHEVWADSVYQSSATLTLGYAVDRSPTFTSKTFNLYDTANLASKRVSLAAGYALGKFLQFKWSNAVIDNYFRLNGYMFLTETKDRIPE